LSSGGSKSAKTHVGSNPKKSKSALNLAIIQICHDEVLVLSAPRW
jgi:hypothetical protein